MLAHGPERAAVALVAGGVRSGCLDTMVTSAGMVSGAARVRTWARHAQSARLLGGRPFPHLARKQQRAKGVNPSKNVT